MKVVQRSTVSRNLKKLTAETMARNILMEIAATKHREVEAMKKVVSDDMMTELALACKRTPLNMKESLRSHHPAIIAEHKRRSPSKGEISPMSDVAETAHIYAANGAAAMSVLTDTPFFGGSLEDLSVARQAAPSLPLLRKEFIVDEYQIKQARLYGADAILLIAAMISAEEIARFNDFAHSLGLQTLVEIHSAEELKTVPKDADLVGVNNRDLTSFSTDIGNAISLIDSLPSDTVKVAESGIKTPEDLRRLKSVGFDAFLIGEALMSAPSPKEALSEFLAAGL